MDYKIVSTVITNQYSERGKGSGPMTHRQPVFVSRDTRIRCLQAQTGRNVGVVTKNSSLGKSFLLFWLLLLKKERNKNDVH